MAQSAQPPQNTFCLKVKDLPLSDLKQQNARPTKCLSQCEPPGSGVCEMKCNEMKCQTADVQLCIKLTKKQFQKPSAQQHSRREHAGGKRRVLTIRMELGFQPQRGNIIFICHLCLNAFLWHITFGCSLATSTTLAAAATRTHSYMHTCMYIYYRRIELELEMLRMRILTHTHTHTTTVVHDEMQKSAKEMPGDYKQTLA